MMETSWTYPGGLPAVGMDGRVARLESMEAKVMNETGGRDVATSSTASATPLCEDTAKNKRKIGEVEASAPDWMVLTTSLGELVGSTEATRVTAFLQAHEEGTYVTATAGGGAVVGAAEEHRFVALPPVVAKDDRRALHEFVRTHLSFCAAADTAAGEGTQQRQSNQIRIWHRSFTSHMPNKLDNMRGANKNRGGGGGAAIPRETPYLQFVLYKENMDTGYALQQIAARASFAGGGNGRGGRGRGGGRGNNNNNNNNRIRMGYAGNKDKRGVTSQFVTIPARDTSVKHLCNVFNGGHAGERGGGGGHTRTAGAGLLRVGNFLHTATELRLGRLRGNRFDVALRNVVTNDDLTITTTTTTTATATMAATKGILEEAATAMRTSGFINYFGTQRFGKYRDTHLTGIAVLRGDYAAAVDLILCPKSDERDEIHAARTLWRDRFLQSVPTDDRAAVEKDVASKVLKAMNRFMQSEIALLNSLVRYPLDYKKAFSCITKTMRMMFIHASQSFLWNKVASFRIDTMGRNVVTGDLVLADDGNTDGNNLTEGCPEVNVVTDEDVATGRYRLDEVVLPLIGVKTHNPENESGALFDVVLKEIGITRAMINTLQDRDFHCAGDYRKLICRPFDVDFEIIEYTDEIQPLLQTDYMKLNGIEVERWDSNTKAVNGAVDTPRQLLLAMVVGFSLPSSSYATIFLRELMKRPTSSDYQRELPLGGGGGLHDGDNDGAATAAGDTAAAPDGDDAGGGEW